MVNLPSSSKEAKALGLRRFLPGTPCKSGHIAEHVVGHGCAECSRLRSAEFRKRHPQRVAVKKAAWQKLNRSRCNEAYRRWEGLAQNLTKKRARNRAYYIANKDKKLTYARRWRAANADQHCAYQHKRRSLKRKAGGRFTAADVLLILAAQNGRCAYCRKKLAKRGYHIDHIVPLSKGGSNHRSNIQICCKSCNSSKGAKDPVDFAKSLGRLI